MVVAQSHNKCVLRQKVKIKFCTIFDQNDQQQALFSLSSFLISKFSSSGPENRHVLPADEACSQPHPVHSEQGETEGEPDGEEWGRGGQGAQYCSHGLLFNQQRRMPGLWLLIRDAKRKYFLRYYHGAYFVNEIFNLLYSIAIINEQIFAVYYLMFKELFILTRFVQN